MYPCEVVIILTEKPQINSVGIVTGKSINYKIIYPLVFNNVTKFLKKVLLFMWIFSVSGPPADDIFHLDKTGIRFTFTFK